MGGSSYVLGEDKIDIHSTGTKMRGAVLAAVAATMGSLLQGWDNATIAGAIIYIKKEFKLETEPTIEGLILAMSLVGSTFITTFSGPVSDKIGRRMMLILSSVLYLLSSLVMFWSPNVYVLLLGRLLDGLGVGLAVTLVPVYISETAPSEIRGQLNTLPQFTGSVGMFLSYSMVFGMSLLKSPSWRLMLGVLGLPSIIYLALMCFYLPESPRWLVSKGRMEEAKRVLQRLRGREDVTAEMALLVEGLGTGGDTSIEEYVIGAESDESTGFGGQNQIKLYGPEQGQSWIAKPVTEQSTLGMVSRHGSMASQRSSTLMDPMVTLFGSVHEKLPQSGSMRSMILPNFGSMFNPADHDQQRNNSDTESPPPRRGGGGGDQEYASDNEENLRSPLLSRYTSSAVPSGSGLNTRCNSSLMTANGVGDIGGGWQLAYKYVEKQGKDGKSEGGYKRVYLHQEETALASTSGSVLSLHGEAAAGGGNVPTEEGQLVQAAAIVSQSALKIDVPLGQIGPLGGQGTVEPSESLTKGATWRDLLEPGVTHALIVGMGLEILQQFSGISGVLFYTPQILDQAGVGVLLSNLGLSSASASLLISAITTLLMLPSIGVAIRLIDVSGRRFLLLSTIPILTVSLVILVISSVVEMSVILHATLSTVSVIVYICCFVMGFGPIPNIVCSEIFPTRVRGICIAICSLTFWFGDIIVTYSLPALLSALGLAGVFGIYAIVCTVSWFFVYLKVPETMGMPLEVICEMFNVGARQAQVNRDII